VLGLVTNTPESAQIDMQAPATFHPIRGSCHCGNIRFVLEWPASGQTIPARACGCSFCVKHGGVWTSHPRARFHLEIADEPQAPQYRFGTKTADFHVCRTCGVVPIVTCTIDGARYAVFNVNTLEGLDKSQLRQTAANFDGEGTEDRLARRRSNWTPEKVIARR
jgi:hypothetical protein